MTNPSIKKYYVVQIWSDNKWTDLGGIPFMHQVLDSARLALRHRRASDSTPARIVWRTLTDEVVESPRESEKLSVEILPEAADALKELADQLEMSPTELINRVILEYSKNR